MYVKEYKMKQPAYRLLVPVVLVLLGLILPTVVWADAHKDKTTEYTDEYKADRNRAVNVHRWEYIDIYTVEPLAKKGNVRAQSALGEFYWMGWDGDSFVKPDRKQALYWFEKAAAKNDPIAQFYLAIIYMGGGRVGVTPNPQKAMYWLDRALKKPHHGVSYHIGLEYWGGGKMLKQDYRKAEQWLILAAAQGSIPAMYKLGIIYEEGWIGSKDLGRARYWFEQAASHSSSLHPLVRASERHLGRMYEKIGESHGLYTQRYWYKFKKIEDLEKALYWYQRAAAKGDDDAKTGVGRVSGSLGMLRRIKEAGSQ